MLENSVDEGLSPQVSVPAVGRKFVAERKVRLGDARPNGNLRLDALARYAQDVSNDDTTDAALPDAMAWVVRKTTIDVMREATFGETLTFTTFCSGMGSRWAERRLQVRGDGHAHYEVATLWVHIDSRTGRPQRLAESFSQTYSESAGGRVITARLEHPEPDATAQSFEWWVRAVDFDLFGHMNNAAYWAAVEEQPDLTIAHPARFSIEYRAGIGSGSIVTLLRTGPDADPTSMWWKVDDKVAASLTAQHVSAELYS